MAPLYLSGFSGSAFSKQPNIVFFIADDISQDDFGCYGHPLIQTPNIDFLAENGMRFDNAYLTTSSCSPPGAALSPGAILIILVHRSCMFDCQMNRSVSELLRGWILHRALREESYVWKQDRAFNQITGGGGPGRSEDWVSHVRKRPKNKPFFLVCLHRCSSAMEYNRCCYPILTRGCGDSSYMVDTTITGKILPDIIMRSVGLITMWDW